MDFLPYEVSVQRGMLTVGELRKAGKIGADLASTLDRLLKPKTKSQYQTLSMVMKEAEAAVKQATRLVDAASRVVP